MLKNSQKSQIASFLKNRDFSLSDFEIISDDDSNIFELSHKASPYYFKIQILNSDVFHVFFSPSASSLNETVISNISWNTSMQYLAKWADYVKEEMESTDPWADLEEEGTFQGDDTMFTPEELALVDKAIDASAQKLIDIAKSEGVQKTLKDINKDIKYLKEEARNRTRYKWRDIFVETFAAKLVEWGISAVFMSGIIQILVKNAEPLLKLMAGAQ